jgi:hypothetical protein
MASGAAGDLSWACYISGCRRRVAVPVPMTWPLIAVATSAGAAVQGRGPRRSPPRVPGRRQASTRRWRTHQRRIPVDVPMEDDRHASAGHGVKRACDGGVLGIRTGAGRVDRPPDRAPHEPGDQHAPADPCLPADQHDPTARFTLVSSSSASSRASSPSRSNTASSFITANLRARPALPRGSSSHPRRFAPKSARSTPTRSTCCSTPPRATASRSHPHRRDRRRAAPRRSTRPQVV